MAWLLGMLGMGSEGAAATGAAEGAAATGATAAAGSASAAGSGGLGLGSMLQGVRGAQQKGVSGFQSLLGMDDLQFKRFMDDNSAAQQRRRERLMDQAQSPPQFYDFGF